MKKKPTKKILVAPLNWGIGHATRCIPIIKELINKGFTPILASDGVALKLLVKEFPDLKSYELPSYNIKYAKKKLFFKWKLVLQFPKIIIQTKREFTAVQKIIKKENIKGIISDNRFGVRSPYLPSVYITHQVTVLSNLTTFITSKLHQKIIKKFDECWIPDTIKTPNLSGKLSISKQNLKLKKIGILSRFKKPNTKNLIKYDVLILLSGVEPQRTLLEQKLITEFKKSTKKILFIRGVFSAKSINDTNNITFKNFVLQDKLQQYLLASNLIIARSGYSTIMDLAILQKKAFFIPTPKQTEQEYLAKHLKKLKIAPFCSQKKFSLKKLDAIKNYKGFLNFETKTNLNFELFE